jgi:hypothetical protein
MNAIVIHPNIPHSLTDIPPIWPSSQMIPVGGRRSFSRFSTAIGRVRRQFSDVLI